MSSHVVYWANALFSEADREFSAKCVAVIRSRGYSVYLPQEATVNHAIEPSAEDIFRIDTEAIIKSKVLIACVDQETIDSGVACEVGIAYASKIPIIGVYTDIRQYRRGPNRMYKNPYVMGAITANGVIVSDIEQVLHHLSSYLNS